MTGELRIVSGAHVKGIVVTQGERAWQVSRVERDASRSGTIGPYLRGYGAPGEGSL